MNIFDSLHLLGSAHETEKIKYGKELCLLVGGSAKARHEERRTSTKKERVS
jgi:hypothetical protein